MNDGKNSDTNLPDGTYAAGQFLFDPQAPGHLIDRSRSYFMKPDQDYEITDQVNNINFVESMVPYKGRWWLYYGIAVSKIAVTSAPLKQKNGARIDDLCAKALSGARR